ncbi:tail fiber domain-containing protein [Alteromonas sp. BMJM2]|uniref:tail fiber domain-containing protein n=1 Tax=Alteromonas sp. BMJM2 TaxID=2954241 RepID=UPI0022B5B945|nr:tail fiber domain-containing protein [Alteromonas sp. BMJM2]
MSEIDVEDVSVVSTLEPKDSLTITAGNENIVGENEHVIEVTQSGLLSFFNLGGSGDGYMSDKSANTTRFGGFVSERSFVRIFLSWIETNVPNHHKVTKVYRSDSNDFQTAVCVGDSQAQTFTDNAYPGVTYFYWLVGETYAGEITPESEVVEVLPTEEGSNLLNILGLNGLIDSLSTLESRLNNSYLGAYLNLEKLAAENLSEALTLINESVATVTSNMVQIESRLGLQSENAIALLNEQLTLMVDGSNALIERVNTLTAEVSTEKETRLAEISRIELAQVSADAALAQTKDELTASIANEKSLREANILNERTARVNAQEVLASSVDSLNAKIVNDVAEINAAIDVERTSRATNESATASQITDIRTGFDTAESTLNSRITNEMISQTSATEALASEVTALDTKVTSDIAAVESTVQEELTSFTTELESVAGRTLTLESSFNGLGETLSATNALINEESTTRANALEAIATRTTNLESSFENLEGGSGGIAQAVFDEEVTTRASEDEALSQKINTLEAKVDTEDSSLSSKITSESTARVEGDQASAQLVEELKVEMVSDIGTSLASAKNYTLSVVGYCTIDDAISEDTTKETCEANGGTWAQLPLSEAMDKVSVSITKPDGTVVSGNAGTFFQALTDDVGNIATRAFLGTDLDGRITGIVATDASGDQSQSNLDLLGSKVNILNDETNEPFISFDTVNKRGVIRGQLILDDGTNISSESDIRAYDGNDGSDGDTVYVEYQYSVNGSSAWHTPMVDGDVYRRERTVTNGTGGSWSSASKIKGEKGATGPQGPRGNDGTPGPAGADGESNYFHIAYANNSTGTSGFNQSSGKYVGTYVDGNPSDSSDPAKYTWKLWEGAQGQDGTDGIPGVDGVDGKTSYLHIAYADNATGTSNFNQNSGKYIGTYVDFNQTDSSDPSKYEWKKFEGDKGTDGADGSDGNDGRDGSIGPGFYTIVNSSGNFPTDSTATTNFTNTFGFAPKENDHLTYKNNGNTNSTVKRFNGSGWTEPSLVVNGDILTKGTVTTDSLAAKAVSADKIDVEDLFAENITVTGSVKAISGNNQVVMSGTENLLNATVGGKTLFNVTSTGDGVVNGRWLTPASIFKNSLSQEVIDFIIGQVGNLAAATGGIRSYEINPITQTNYVLGSIPHGTKPVRVSLSGSANDTVSGPNYPAAPRVIAKIVRDGTVIKEYDFQGTVEDFSEQGFNQYVRTLNFNIAFDDTGAPDDSEVTYWVNFSSMSSNFPSGSEASFSVSEDGDGGASFSWGSVTGKPETATRWPTKSEVGLSNVNNVGLNWQWGTGTISHIWGSQGSSTESYVYTPDDLRNAMDLSGYMRKNTDESTTGNLTISNAQPTLTMNDTTGTSIVLRNQSGVMYFDVAGSAKKIYHEGHKPTYNELGTIGDAYLPFQQDPKKFIKNAHTFGEYKNHLELYAPEGSASGEVSILFHQGSRFYYQLRANKDGLHVTSGNSLTLRELHANFKGTLDSSKITITGGGTIGGSSWSGAWLNIGSSSSGWAIDNNEMYNTANGIIGTFSGFLNLNPATDIRLKGRVRLNVSSNDILQIQNDSGYVRIGANNEGYMHFYTDREQYYFDSSVQVDGQIRVYGSSNYITTVGFYGNGAGLSEVNATKLDGLNSTSFLRSDTSDTMTGNLTIDAGTDTTLNVKSNDSGRSLIRAYGDSQGTGAVEVGQSTTYGGGMSYNGDGTPVWANGEIADTVTFYRLDNGTRTAVFSYRYNNSEVVFTKTPTVNGNSIWHSANDGSGSGLDADRIHGYLPSVSEARDTVVVRNGSNDVYARLFRSSYNNQGSLPDGADVCFRNDNGNDNYMRFVNQTGFVDWVERTNRFALKQHYHTHEDYMIPINGIADKVDSASSPQGKAVILLCPYASGGDNNVIGQLITQRTSANRHLNVVNFGFSANSSGGMAPNYYLDYTSSQQYNMDFQIVYCVYQGTTWAALRIDGARYSISEAWFQGYNKYRGTNSMKVLHESEVSGVNVLSDYNGNKKVFNSDVYVSGEVSSADTRARSDIRVKRNLKPIDNALERVNALSGYTYDEINLNKRMASIIAQDLREVLPEGVGEDSEGMLSVSPMSVIGLLVNAVKELSQEVKELKHGNL